MDFVFEIIFELVFEGSLEIAKSKKVSKWIRYPLIILISLFLIFIIGIIGFIGVSLIVSKENYSIYGGIIVILFDIIVIIFGTKNIFKKIKSKKTNN